MKKLIIDSSVIVKWLNQTNEERLQEADNVIKDVKEEKVNEFDAYRLNLPFTKELLDELKLEKEIKKKKKLKKKR